METVIQGERAGREFRQRRHFIVRAEAAHIAHRGFEKWLAEKFASGALGRFSTEVIMFKPAAKERFARVAARGPCAVSVHRPFAVRQFAHGEVHQHIGGTRVECHNGWTRASTPIERSHVADAAQVIDAHMLAAPSENKPVKGRGQRRALSAGGHVGRAKIADDRHAQPLHQIGRFAELERGGREAGRIVEDSLAVQAGQSWISSIRIGLRNGVTSIESSQVVMRLRQRVAPQFAPCRGVQRFPQNRREQGGPERAQNNAFLAHAAQRVINAIHARARHNAKDKTFLHE